MATKSFGAVLTWNNGLDKFSIAQLTNLSPFSLNQEIIESTTHGTTAAKTYLPTLKSIDPITVEFLFDPVNNTHNELLTQVADSAEGLVGTIEYVSNQEIHTVTDCLVTMFQVMEQTTDGLLKGSATLAPYGSTHAVTLPL